MEDFYGCGCFIANTDKCNARLEYNRMRRGSPINLFLYKYSIRNGEKEVGRNEKS
jgi:hypothetical protein